MHVVLCHIVILMASIIMSSDRSTRNLQGSGLQLLRASPVGDVLTLLAQANVLDIVTHPLVLGMT